MRIKTSTTFTPSGKVRVKTTVRPAPLVPALRASATYSLIPAAAPARKRRRKKR